MPNGPKQTKRDVIINFDAATHSAAGQSWFLGIGINQYKHFPQLNNAVKALHTLLISDSCFSGSLFVRGATRSTAAINELASLPSRWALCSGRHDEEVFDGEPGKNSPFAESIMNTLRHNAKRAFNVAKLVDRVVEQTRANYNQLPEGNPLFGVGHKGGQYVFRRRAVEAEDWADAKAAGTLPAYRQFLDNHPDGKQAAEAKKMIVFLEEEAAWEKAKAANTVLAYYEYDQAYSEGRYHYQALDAIAELEEAAAWQDAQRRNKLSAYRKYTSDYPQGKHRAEAEAGMAAIVVFIGPFSSESQCGKAVERYRKTDPKVYGVKISNENERVEIRGEGRARRIPNYNPNR